MTGLDDNTNKWGVLWEKTLSPAIDRCLAALPSSLRPWAVAFAAWALSLTLYSPPLWIGLPSDTRFWDFAKQAEDPLRRDLCEPILAFRIVPPLIAYVSGLRGYWVLVIQYAAVILALALLFAFMRKRLGDGAASLAVLAFALSEMAIASNTWLAYPDALAWCFGISALLVRSSALKAAFAAAGGLTDERFVLALPGIVLIEVAEATNWRLGWRALARCATPYIGGILGLVVIRLSIAGGLIGEPVSHLAVYEYLRENLQRVIPRGVAQGPATALGSLAFSYRWLWLFPFLALTRGRNRAQRLFAGLSLVYVPAVAYLVFLGGDWTRSFGCLFPVFVLCMLLVAGADNTLFRRAAVATIIMMMVTPMINFDATRTGWVRPLPVAVVRAIREGAFPARWLSPPVVGQPYCRAHRASGTFP